MRRHHGSSVLYVTVWMDHHDGETGYLLMEWLHERCRSRHRPIVLTAEKANDRAVALYRRMGYATVGSGQSEWYMTLCLDTVGGLAAVLLRGLLWCCGKCR